MEKCDWKIVDVDENHYESECGGDWFFFEGTIEDNQMKVCPFCGEPVNEIEPVL